MTNLHEKIEWFYRKVCAELDVPVSNPFIFDVLNKQFKAQVKSAQRGILINTLIFNERNTFVICETLKKFQRKISTIEIHHNMTDDMDKDLIRIFEADGVISVGGFRKTACPQAVYLVGLLKALRQCKSIKIVCNPDSYPLVHDATYKQLVFALTRSAISKSRREERTSEEPADWKPKKS